MKAFEIIQLRPLELVVFKTDRLISQHLYLKNSFLAQNPQETYKLLKVDLHIIEKIMHFIKQAIRKSINHKTAVLATRHAQNVVYDTKNEIHSYAAQWNASSW